VVINRRLLRYVPERVHALPAAHALGSHPLRSSCEHAKSTQVPFTDALINCN